MINAGTKIISLYKQDTVKVSFQLTLNGSIYALKAGEKVVCTVKKDTDPASEILFEQVFSGIDSTVITVVFDIATQEKLPYGDYLYDVRWHLESGLRTGVAPTKLSVLPVVGYV